MVGARPDDDTTMAISCYADSGQPAFSLLNVVANGRPVRGWYRREPGLTLTPDPGAAHPGDEPLLEHQDTSTTGATRMTPNANTWPQSLPAGSGHSLRELRGHRRIASRDRTGHGDARSRHRAGNAGLIELRGEQGQRPAGAVEGTVGQCGLRPRRSSLASVIALTLASFKRKSRNLPAAAPFLVAEPDSPFPRTRAGLGSVAEVRQRQDGQVGSECVAVTRVHPVADPAQRNRPLVRVSPSVPAVAGLGWPVVPEGRSGRCRAHRHSARS